MERKERLRPHYLRKLRPITKLSGCFRSAAFPARTVLLSQVINREKHRDITLQDCLLSTSTPSIDTVRGPITLQNGMNWVSKGK